MMRLKLLTARAHADGRSEQWGDIIEVSDSEGRKLLANGLAMRPDDEHETAALVTSDRGATMQRATIKRGA